MCIFSSRKICIMLDFNSLVATIIVACLQFFPFGSLNGNARLPKTGARGVGIAEIFQGKDGLTIHLIPQGEVGLTLYALDGSVVEVEKDYASPSVIQVTYVVPKKGYYLLVARHGMQAESFMLYLTK